MQSPAVRVASLLLALAAASGVGTVACSSSSGSPTSSPAAATPDDDAGGTTPPAAAGDGGTNDAAAPDKCAAAPSASGCNIASSWVRGTAKFDASHFKAGTKPVLRVTLRHGFALLSGEDKIGGRLHAWQSIELTDGDLAKGQVAFAIDMCQLGTAMWSEENGTFNLVVIFDENGNNDLDKAQTNDEAIVMGTPDKGELVKLVPVDVSCHSASACLDVTADCTDGAACTTVTPITTCKKKTPSCTSDDAFCH